MPEGRSRSVRRRRPANSTMSTTDSLAYFLPELVLSAAILAVVLLDLISTGPAGRRASELPGSVALIGTQLHRSVLNDIA